jgi:hypothetical protein
MECAVVDLIERRAHGVNGRLPQAAPTFLEVIIPAAGVDKLLAFRIRLDLAAKGAGSGLIVGKTTFGKSLGIELEDKPPIDGLLVA